MVQIASRAFFVLSIAVSSLAIPAAIFKRDVATVKADIAQISTQVTALDTLITAYPNPGGTLAGALAIHNSAVVLTATIGRATTDTVASSPFSQADGQDILTSVQAIEPTIFHALDQIVAKKPAFVALPLGGVPALILQDLKFLNGNTTAFANALIAKSPTSLVPTATTIRDNVVAAFAVAIAAYS